MNLLDIGYFRLAKNVSKLSDHRVKVGAVLVGKRPLMACSNKAKTHPRWADPTKGLVGSMHAEIRAVIMCKHENLEDSIIYVYREDSRGNPKIARPCSLCQEVLKDIGCKWMFYTIEEYPYWRRERII